MNISMTWPEAYNYWLRALKARSRGSETWITYSRYVRSWGRWGDPMRATHRDVLAWLDAHPQWGPYALKSARSALGSFYRLMVEEEVLTVNPMLRVPRLRQPRRVPRPAEESAVRAGLGARDADTRLMVALAAHAGLRRAEIAGLRRGDVVRDGLVVRGKGDAERWVPLDPFTAAHLRARPAGFVFPGRFSGHVHPATVTKRIKAASAVSPHPMRHRYATVVYDGSGDLLSVRDLLGHASVATTQGYVALAQRRLRAAAVHAWEEGPEDPMVAVAA